MYQIRKEENWTKFVTSKTPFEYNLQCQKADVKDLQNYYRAHGIVYVLVGTTTYYTPINKRATTTRWPPTIYYAIN